MNFKKTKFTLIIKRLLIFLFVFSILFVDFTVAENNETNTTNNNINYDISLNIIINETVNDNTTYDRIFKITNLNYSNNVEIQVFLEANITKITLENETTDDNETNNYFYAWNASRKIKSFGEASLGTINLEKGKYYLCGYAYSEYQDPYMENNYACKTLWAGIEKENETQKINETEQTNETNQPTDENNETNENNETEEEQESLDESPNYSENFCECSLNIWTTKKIYETREKVEFKIYDCYEKTQYINPVTYWVEDLFGTITKNEYTSVSKALKSWTPNINQAEKSFLIKAKFRDCNKTSETLFSVKNELQKKETHFFINVQEHADKDFFVDIQGHKADTLKTLITITLEKDEKKYYETKIYVQEKNQDFKLRIPISVEKIISGGEYDLRAEGLDYEDNKKIIIQKNSNEKEDETINVKKYELKISTRKINFEENINLQVNIQGELTGKEKLRIITPKQELIIDLKNENKSFVQEIKIDTYKDVILAEIYNEKGMLTSAYLKLNLTLKNENVDSKKDDEKKVEEQELLLQKLLEPISDEKTNNDVEQEKTETQSTNKITGLITNIKSKETKKKIIYIITGIILLIAVFFKEIKNININRKKGLKNPKNI